MTTAGNQGQNVYPAPVNYPASSFPQPVPAPDVDPDDAGTLITVQYSWEWQQTLLAAVDQLLNPATWQGDHDAIILALERATNLKDLLQTPVASDLEKQPPYWDETKPEEAGNEDPPETGEPWYDAPAYTIVTAFLSTIISPPAAVTFVTTIRKLRLFFIYGQHGALTDILVDGDTVATVDTYAPTETLGVIDVIIPA